MNHKLDTLRPRLHLGNRVSSFANGLYKTGAQNFSGDLLSSLILALDLIFGSRSDHWQDWISSDGVFGDVSFFQTEQLSMLVAISIVSAIQTLE